MLELSKWHKCFCFFKHHKSIIKWLITTCALYIPSFLKQYDRFVWEIDWYTELSFGTFNIGEQIVLLNFIYFQWINWSNAQNQPEWFANEYKSHLIVKLQGLIAHWRWILSVNNNYSVAWEDMEYSVTTIMILCFCIAG